MPAFNVLILSGGGAKGYGQLGALHYFYENKLLDIKNITTFAGTSIGSVICLLLMCGYEPLEILSSTYDTNFLGGVNTKNPGMVANFTAMFEKFGVMDIQPFADTIASMVMSKLHKIPTLRELYTITGKKLIIAVTNVTKIRVEYFSYITEPELSVIDAIKMSCNLPLIFQRINYKDCFYSDGGLADNFAIDIPIETTEPKHILGIITYSVPPNKDVSDTFLNYMYKLISIPMNAATFLKSKIVNGPSTIVSIKFENIPLFTLDKKDKHVFFQKGYREAKFTSSRKNLYIHGWDDIRDGWDIDF